MSILIGSSNRRRVQSILGEGLLRYYPMTSAYMVLADPEPMKDASGNGLHLATSGILQSHIIDSPGFGECIDMGGKTDRRVGIIGSTLRPSNTTPYTISVWLRLTNLGLTGWPCIFTFPSETIAACQTYFVTDDISSYSRFQMGEVNSTTEARRYGVNGNFNTLWQNHILTYNGQEVRNLASYGAYVNDVSSLINKGVGFSATDATALIGGRNNRADQYWWGELAHWRFYDRVLTAAARAEIVANKI